jgi:nucleotide-binding universal stress UspA family protein
MAIRKLLVPTDFSDGALQALEYAIDLAREVDAELLVLFVVEPVYSATGGELYSGSMDPSVVLEEQRRIGNEQLSRLGRRLDKRAIRFLTVLETGTPYRIIAEVAEKSRADLIVMATHGRTGLSHLLVGSVTEKVIRTAPCPVLTLRADTAKGRRSKSSSAKTLG